MLADGDNTLAIDGVDQPCRPEQEYVRLYRRFAELVASGQSHADLAPLRLAADAFLCGRMTATDSYSF
jgi:D-galactose 1-dehydrogenase